MELAADSHVFVLSGITPGTHLTVCVGSAVTYGLLGSIALFGKSFPYSPESSEECY